MYTSDSNYVADTVFPEVQVSKRSGFYYVYDKSKYEPVNDVRAPGTRAKLVDYGLSTASYGPLNDHALEHFIDDDEMDEAPNPISPFNDASENLTERILLNKEIDAASKLTNTAVITQNLAMTGTQRWDDYANSDPIADAKTAQTTIKAAFMKKPNTVLITYEVWLKLIEHPMVLDRIKWSERGVVTKELIAQLFEVENVIIADAQKQTSIQGQTTTIGYVWGKRVIFMYINSKPGIKTASAGYTLSKGGRVAERWDDRTVKGQFTRVSHYYQQYMMAAEAVYLYNTVIS
jgi:hypothetical protein